MSDRAQALEAANEAADRAFAALIEHCESPDEYQEVAEPFSWAFNLYRDALLAVLAAPPVGVSPQPDTRRDCTCLGTCRGAEGLGPRWKCALEKSASLSPVEPTPEPPPDAQVCVWREREWDYESGCRGTQISRDERSSGPPDGWKHCPYCGKRLEVGTAPQGGEQ